MNPLILAALGLSDSAWPPDYYTLLGLTPESASPNAVETAVLDRMEKLRAYQLAHPEPVTEAMNLLARALEALAEPAARERYDAGRGLTFKPAPMPEERVYFVQPVVPNPPFPVAQLVAPQPRPPRSEPTGNPATRRRVRQLVSARRLLDAWDAAGPYLSSPTYMPPSRLAAVEIIAAFRRVVELTPDESEEVPGGAVLALARSPVTSQGLLEMSDARRELLADDWRAGRHGLLDTFTHARRQVGRRGVGDRLRRWTARQRQQIPRTLAATAAVAACVVALYRWLA